MTLCTKLWFCIKGSCVNVVSHGNISEVQLYMGKDVIEAATRMCEEEHEREASEKTV